MMSDTKPSLMKDIEELVTRSMEANKIFITESPKLFRQLSGIGKSGQASGRTEVISNIFNAYMKLGVRHMHDMIDLGLSLLTEISADAAENGDEAVTEKPEPAFTLSGSAIAGGKVSLQFILDNEKKESVSCQLVNSDYYHQADPAVTKIFKTVFSPQSFILNPGASQTVKIDVGIPKTAIPGNYTCEVQVRGFEPAYFAIQLSIDPIRS
ncbi:hypothetical protein [Dyadobacter bucti]|uniref:hypothetical protein n=1 Tax=Dyadobacter bucti TaxID=2572203 RepID=UPI001107D973|nr:hypothetical protein [Dyadobacter bucti]